MFAGTKERLQKYKSTIDGFYIYRCWAHICSRDNTIYHQTDRETSLYFHISNDELTIMIIPGLALNTHNMVLGDIR